MHRTRWRDVALPVGRHWLVGLVVASALAGACATNPPLTRQQCYNPAAQLAAVLQPFQTSCASGSTELAAAECDRLRREIQRLALVCPSHPSTLMANAILAYDDHQPVVAQQFLDRILAQPQTYPDGAALRARIALEEGNLPFAHRLLEQQIRVAPDHAGLREAYGAVFFLEGQLQEASEQLVMAAALGAPGWRIAYHLGLIDEALGRTDEARRHFTESLAGNPAWGPAQSHLNGLRAQERGASPP